MLTTAQLSIVQSPTDSRLFLRGPAGTGKTTASVERMKFLLEQGIPADQILVLTPQRTLQDPYLELIHSPQIEAGGEVTPATIGGLARRMLDLFWPLAAEMAGFASPEKNPVFLTLETAQYYMASLVRPHLEQGWFQSVVMDRNRLYSQVLDNLNKAAMVGFPYEQIGERLTSAWSGEPAQRRVFADVQACATEFRQFCLQHNLLDFSLQLEIFANILWNDPTVRHYLVRSYRHIIYDNIEEDVPVAHDLLSTWLPECDSALLVLDEEAGYRQFLGADPGSALELGNACEQTARLDESFVINAGLAKLSSSLANAISPQEVFGEERRDETDIHEVLSLITSRYYPEMLDGVAAEVQRLINEEQVPASEIAVLSPYLSDALRFSLASRLEARGVHVRSHRPSRSLREEPASICLLTLAALAHPAWELRPAKSDLAHTLVQIIDGMDLVRAQLLAEIVYRAKTATLSPFEQINPDMQERITYLFGERYSQLKDWLEAYQAGAPQPLDHFLRRLFGELLSQPGFGFHRNLDAARVAASLIESVQKFRWAMEPTLEQDRQMDIGKEYIAMLNDGVIAAQYISAWSQTSDEAVLMAPAHTFLMANRPVRIQFWLDAGSSGWYERLFQPLTHPYVLSRHWVPGQVWTDENEVEANTTSLKRLLSGLLNRCRDRIYLGLTDLSESGYEQRGVLVRAFQKVLQQN
ncbi:MAG TPA: UvrD-helicase domain-containing protein [Anaerolineales bacterium]